MPRIMKIRLIDLHCLCKNAYPGVYAAVPGKRNIPAKLIVPGHGTQNLPGQLAQCRLAAQGRHCRCDRCREIGRLPSDVEPDIRVTRYQCCDGTERYCGIQETPSSALPGFLFSFIGVPARSGSRPLLCAGLSCLWKSRPDRS